MKLLTRFLICIVILMTSHIAYCETGIVNHPQGRSLVVGAEPPFSSPAF